MKIAVTKAKAEPTAIPAMRNGSRISQISGNSTSATKASGQQITRRMHQSRNFTISAFLHVYRTQPRERKFPGASPPGNNSDMASIPLSPLTEEQYLELEREAEAKSEFHDGQMF